ncbi:MAG: hypothetical protein BWY89_01765 [Bacteroidetes bacterium ADurb.BinA012]|nr:MAG: hypothetical protein BWY89_01765 [Bacteroidetes bacterium ADurb.BinA012]
MPWSLLNFWGNYCHNRINYRHNSHNNIFIFNSIFVFNTR